MSNLVKLLFQRCHHCLQKWNQIALLMEKTDLILIMLGCISYFSISSYISSHIIALTSGSSQRRFEHCLVMSLKYAWKKYALFWFLETTSSYTASIILLSKFVICLVKKGLQNFQKFLKIVFLDCIIYLFFI